MHTKLLLKIISASVLTAVLFLFFYINPQPSFIPFKSYDALPGGADFIIIFIKGSVILASCIWVFISSRGKGFFNIMCMFLLYVCASFILFKISTQFFDPIYLKSQQARASFEYQRPSTYDGTSYLDSLKKACGEQTNIQLVFTKIGLRGNQASEVEFMCGEMTGVYDISVGTIHSFSECTYNIRYNSIMRTIGSLKRKSCLTKFN